MRKYSLHLLVSLITCLTAINAVQADSSLAGNDWCRIHNGNPVCDSRVEILGSNITIFHYYPITPLGTIFEGTLVGQTISGYAFSGWPNCGRIKGSIISSAVSNDLKKIEITYKDPKNTQNCTPQEWGAKTVVFIRKQW